MKIKNLNPSITVLFVIIALGLLSLPSAMSYDMTTIPAWNDTYDTNSSRYLILLFANFSATPSGTSIGDGTWCDETGRWCNQNGVSGGVNMFDGLGAMQTRGTGGSLGYVTDGTMDALSESVNWTCITVFNKSQDGYGADQNNIFYFDYSVGGRIGHEDTTNGDIIEAGSNIDSFKDYDLCDGNYQKIVMSVREDSNKFDMIYTDGCNVTHFIFNNSNTNGDNGILQTLQVTGSSKTTTANFSMWYFICFDGNRTEVPLLPTVSDVFAVDLYLTDDNGNLYPELNDEFSVSEDDEFFIGNNYTVNDILAINDSVCNFTAGNISAHFTSTSITNQSIANSNTYYSLVFSENNNSLLSDGYEVSVCRNTVKADLQLYINDILYYTIDQDLIPLCANGFYTEKSNTTDFNNVSSINFTVGCLTCNPATLVIVTDDDDELLHYERNYEKHFENMTFNSTLGIYRKESHKYHYKKSGEDVGNITIACNNSVTEDFIFNITNVNLTIDVFSIDDIAFTEGMEIEQENITDILIEVSGDFVSFLEFNLTYVNGTVIKSETDEYMQVETADLTSEGILNITVYAKDDEDNIAEFETWFIINDTTNPTIQWINPLSTNATIYDFNTSESLSISLFDINLFAYNITVYKPDGSIAQNRNETDTTNQTKSVIILTQLDQNGTWIIDASVSDDHTKNEIEDYKIKEEIDTLYFDDIKITGVNAVKSKAIKKKDRYNFEFEYYDDNPYKAYIIESPNKLYYREHSKYKAHFVDFVQKKWIDFDYNSNVPPYVYKLNDSSYRVEIYSHDDIILFNSIGGLNIENEQIQFEVNPPADETETLLFDFDLTQLSNVVLLFVLIFLWIALQTLSFTFNNFAFGSFAFFIGIIIGFLFVNLSVFLTILFIIMNISLYISLARRKKT